MVDLDEGRNDTAVIPAPEPASPCAEGNVRGFRVKPGMTLKLF